MLLGALLCACAAFVATTEAVAVPHVALDLTFPEDAADDELVLLQTTLRTVSRLTSRGDNLAEEYEDEMNAFATGRRSTEPVDIESAVAKHYMKTTPDSADGEDLALRFEPRDKLPWQVREGDEDDEEDDDQEDDELDGEDYSNDPHHHAGHTPHKRKRKPEGGAAKHKGPSFDRRANIAVSTADTAIEKAKRVLDEVQLAISKAEDAKQETKVALALAKSRHRTGEQSLIALDDGVLEGDEPRGGPREGLASELETDGVREVREAAERHSNADAADLGLPNPNPPRWLRKLLHSPGVQL